MSLAAHDVRDRPELPPSWPSKNNCNSYVQRLSRRIGDTDDANLPPGLPADRPVSVEPGTTLRDEARQYRSGDTWVPAHHKKSDKPISTDVQARPTGAVLREWRAWMDDYRGTSLVFENEEGEESTMPMLNSYMADYSDTYYARLKQFERAVERHYADPTTVILTLTESTENDRGRPRSPADHMREIADGWHRARQELYDLLSGYEWEYLKIWEPHKSGYGHLHVGLVIDGRANIGAGDFVPFLETYTDKVRAAGTAAHTVDNAVSVNDDIENMGSYLSEYLGIYGESESVLDRPVSEQMFYAVTWATNTRRIEFSQGAQELIDEQRDLERREERREETATTAADRGVTAAAESREDAPQPDLDTTGGNQEVWNLVAIEDEEDEREPPPQGGPIKAGPIDGYAGWDRPKRLE